MWIALALSACAVDELATGHVEQQAMCPPSLCNDNSPVMGPYSFWEGNLEGLENGQKVRFGDFVIGSTRYRPQVIGDQLRACNALGACRTGTQLTNGYFEVFTPDGMFKIVVAKVSPKATSSVTFWIGPASRIETYELAFVYPNGSPGDTLCANPPEHGPNGATEGPTFTWNAPLEAMFFTGDRYDAETRTVTTIDPAKTRGWFNIACAGSSLAKLHLTRHTTVSTIAPSYVTSRDHRQAMLRMYASFICGQSHTVKGTPLHWQNAFGWNKLTGTENAFEARWTAKGPECLDTHRLGTAKLLEIQAACSKPGMSMPPPCNGSVTNPAFPGSVYVDTAVPFAVP